MPTRIPLTLVLALVVFAGCGTQGGATAADEPAASKASWPDRRESLGQETYEAACARCHESGEGGAPRTGVREDWSGRSDMWQAVLFRHARDGYLAMPEKGGAADLGDEAVDAASEYILEKTFPDRPRD